jgi:hypothetical protein
MTGKAFLLFGNDIAPSMRDAYERWHAEHHVPQRLTVPGILGAIRFRGVGAGRPEYFTLYRLSAAQILESPSYRALIDEPDETTRAMRPHFRAPVRFVARTDPMPLIPAGHWMRVETGDLCPPPAEAACLSISGRLVGDQRNHPIMKEQNLPQGSIRLSFAPREKLAARPPCQGHDDLEGLYRPLDRFGLDAQGAI